MCGIVFISRESKRSFYVSLPPAPAFLRAPDLQVRLLRMQESGTVGTGVVIAVAGAETVGTWLTGDVLIHPVKMNKTRSNMNGETSRTFNFITLSSCY